MTIVVHACAAATSLKELIVPVHLFPTRAVSVELLNSTRVGEASTVKVRASNDVKEANMVRLSSRECQVTEFVAH